MKPMKNSYTFLIIAVVAIFGMTSCKTSKDLDTKNSPAESSMENVDSTLVSNTPPVDTIIPRNFFASIERSPCFGKCPTYKMTIYSDGFVEFEGIRNTEMIGNYTTTISQKKVQNFVSEANAIGFMELKDSYDGAISDVPSATIVLVQDGVRKEVYRRFDYPKRILIFEKCFDNLIQTERWVSSTGEVYPSEK